MSKALSYTEAVDIIAACDMVGARIPSLKYIMLKRKNDSWDPILEQLTCLQCETSWFKDAIEKDMDLWG